MTSHNPLHTSSPDRPEETIAERSARLEAEARALSEKSSEEGGSTPSFQEPITGTSVPSDVAFLQQQLDATKDQMIRALAEAENIRKRAMREREDIAKYSISSFAKDLLDVSDNLRRALEAIPAEMVEQDTRLKNLIDGIEATERTLLRTFEKHGITKINPLHEIFDPNFHEVMFEAPVPGKPAGTVIQILESGYLLQDRLLRPARVGVVKDDGSASQTPTGGHLDTQA